MQLSATRASLPLILRSLAPNKEALAILQQPTSAHERLGQLKNSIQTGQSSLQRLQHELDANRGECQLYNMKRTD